MTKGINLVAKPKIFKNEKMKINTYGYPFLIIKSKLTDCTVKAIKVNPKV